MLFKVRFLNLFQLQSAILRAARIETDGGTARPVP